MKPYNFFGQGSVCNIHNYAYDPDGEPHFVGTTVLGCGGFEEVLKEELGEECFGKKALVKVYILEEEEKQSA